MVNYNPKPNLTASDPNHRLTAIREVILSEEKNTNVSHLTMTYEPIPISMKKTILLCGLFTAFTFATAQKVALHSLSGVQHFTGVNGFIDAYNASVSGDTIYLPGGGFNTPGNIDKSLLIFGAGHYPDSTQATAKTFINGSITVEENADGFRMEGIHLFGSFNYGYNMAVDNTILKYCYIEYDINVQGNLTNPTSNMMVLNCVIGGAVYLNNMQNAAVYNSIIQNRILYSIGTVFENNILMFSYTGGSAYFTIHGDNNICRNNIFLNASNKAFTGVSNQAYNNIFVTNPSYGTTPIESGNYTPVPHSSIFINQSGYLFDYAHDYHLQDPVTYLGTDGTQVGIYGGVLGYKEGAVPSNPHIQWENIAPTTTSGGLLNIQINAAAQDQ